MVEFGKQLQDSKAKGKSEWSAYYIDYDKLKKLLKNHKPKSQSFSGMSMMMTSQESPGQASNSRSLSDLSSWLSSDYKNNNNNNNRITSKFQHALDQEIEKVVLFLLDQQGALAHDLSFLNEKRALCRQQVQAAKKLFGQIILDHEARDDLATVEDVKSVLQKLYQEYRSNANLVLDFIQYVELNVTAVRKILKKHDKNVPNSSKLSQSYLAKLTNKLDSHLDQLYNYGGLTALMVTLKKAFGELHEMELALLELQYKDNNPTTLVVPPTTSHRRVQSDSIFMFKGIMGDDDDEMGQESTTSNQQPQKPPGHARRASNLLFATTANSSNSNSSSNRHKMLLVSLCTVTKPYEPVLSKIHAARNRLKQSTKYVEVVAAQSLMMLDEQREEGDEAEADEDSKIMTRSQQISSFLNLCSTFLYMTNYYIVAPTSGQYADKLGSSEAMAGIIIGMTPNAALVATVLYGWWSNHSYKSALIFASSCSLIGNVFYALALHKNSMTYVMLGRFFNGFGSARSINRRFIADTFSRADRTAASANFVVAGGLGMAVGPAIAAILGKVEYPPDSDLFTVETAPGWVMLSLWSAFFICFIFLFEEPDRSHIYGVVTTKTNTATNGTTNGEEQPLLQKSDSTGSGSGVNSPKTAAVKKEPPIYKNIPVMLTLFLYFVLKFALECLLSSSATVTTYYFHWDSQHTGAFLAFLGLLNFPANMFVARLSHNYQERELIYGCLWLMLISVLGIFVYNSEHYSSYQYMTFSILVFLSANCLEGPNMSLLSKVIPKSWAKGIFNSGFLATEAGTAARSIGNVLISAMATWIGRENFLNATFLPLLLSVLLAIGLVRSNFETMVEIDEDDEDEQQQQQQQQEEEEANQLGDVEKMVRLK